MLWYMKKVMNKIYFSMYYFYPLKNLFYFYFILWGMWDFSSLIKEQLCPLHWEHGVLTTRPPGNPYYFYSWICTKAWKTTQKTDNWLWESYYLFFLKEDLLLQSKSFTFYGLSPLKLTSILSVLPILSYCIS